MKTALHLLLAIAALAAPGLALRAADVPAQEDPIGRLLSDYAATHEVKITALPEVSTLALKVTVDLNGKPPLQARYLVEKACFQAGIQFRTRPDGTLDASVRPNDHIPRIFQTANVGEGKVEKMIFADIPLKLALDDLLEFGFARTITVPSDLLTERRGEGITLAIANVTSNQFTRLLRDAIQQQAGVVLDEQTDGNWNARKRAEVNEPTSRVDSAELSGVVVYNESVPRELLNALQQLMEREIQYSNGVESIRAKFSFSASFQPKTVALIGLRNMLEQQADIVIDEFPDGALRARLRTEPNDPVEPRKISRVFFLNDPVATGLNRLKQWSNRRVRIPTEIYEIDRRLTLSIDRPILTGDAIALLRTALNEQAGIVIDDLPDGSLGARMLDKSGPSSAPTPPAASPKS